MATTTNKNNHGGARRGAGRKPNSIREEMDAIRNAFTFEQKREAFNILYTLATTEGNVKALEIYLAYMFGKPQQKHEVTGEDGEPIQIKVIYTAD